MRLAPGKTERPAKDWTVKLMIYFTIGVLGLLGGMFVSQHFPGSAPSALPEIDARPVLLAVKQIGALHSATMNFKDVMKFSSDKQAEGWFKDLPGVNDLEKWATHNEVLIVAEGSVEAGVDLSKIGESDVFRDKQADGSEKIVVRLPAVEIYAPQIKTHVEHNESGLLWKDDNLIPKAQNEASNRFSAAAEKANIRTQAQEGALKTLNQLQQNMGWKNVSFKF